MRKITLEELELLKNLSTNKELNFNGCSHVENYYGVEQSYIKDNLSIEAKENIKKINTILKEVIGGYSTFYNFTNTGIRYSLNYNYKTGNPSFIGVDYISIEQISKLN